LRGKRLRFLFVPFFLKSQHTHEKIQLILFGAMQGLFSDQEKFLQIIISYGVGGQLSILYGVFSWLSFKEVFDFEQMGALFLILSEPASVFSFKSFERGFPRFIHFGGQVKTHWFLSTQK
jgi:hypothetical protein